jgi:hypothetical protein
MIWDLGLDQPELQIVPGELGRGSGGAWPTFGTCNYPGPEFKTKLSVIVGH